MRIECLICEYPIEIGLPVNVGERMACQNCRASLEVVWLFPLTLDLVEVGPGRAVELPSDDVREAAL